MNNGAIYTPQVINHSLFTCRICGENFKSEKRKNMHEDWCNAKQQLDSDNSGIIPSNAELFKMIQLQRMEIEKLKKELMFAKRGEIVHKKVELVDWLNENIRPNIQFNDFIERIQGTIENINMVFDNGYLEGTTQLFSKHYHSLETNAVPVYGFTQKEGILFYYSGKEWKMIDADFWEKICVILKQIQTKSFEVWKDTEIINMLDDKQQALWLDRLQRLQCITPYGCANLHIKLKKKIWQSIKINFKEFSKCDLI